MNLSIILNVLLLFVGVSIANKIFTPNFDDDHEKNIHPGDYLLQSKPKNFQLPRPGEDTNEFWLNNAKNFVEHQLKKKLNTNIAKNVIIFLGDGMGIATTAASRVYMGGEEETLSFEELPDLGLSKTYCVNMQVADSASTATSYLNGVKTNYGVVGVNAHVPRYDCKKQLDKSTHTQSIAKWAMDAGKVAGFVTTTKVTDASPAGLYAHSANRYWENNQDILDSKCNDKELDDVAEQLVYNEEGSNLKVILGGGRQEFRDVKMCDEENQENLRTDGKDLIQEWLDGKKDTKYKFVWNSTDLMAVNANETDYLLGLFEGSHCRYHLEVLEEHIEHIEPTLSQMVDKAIDILAKNENGFFLFVEGGRIDLAHHGTYSRIALDETTEFAKALNVARSKLSDDDTLFVVTADHSHTMSYSGYAYRGSDIFGPGFTLDEIYDNTPYMVLNYVDGPGFKNHMQNGKRVDPTKLNTEKIRFQFPASLPRSTESHAGEDVTIHAIGPWSHLFTGVIEQNVIPHAMAYAACIGNGLTACDDERNKLLND